MASNTSALVPSDTLDRKRPPTDLREVIRDLMSMEDQEAASRRLVEKLVSFSSGDVDVVKIGQTRLFPNSLSNGGNWIVMRSSAIRAWVKDNSQQSLRQPCFVERR